MFDDAFGLPLHVLVIHAVVAFVPLLALIAIAYAVVPAWRWLLRWPLLLGSAGCLAAGFVAMKSGEAFLEQLNSPEFVLTHAAQGRLLYWLLLALFAVSVAATFLLGGPNPLRDNLRRVDAAPTVQVIVAVLLVAAAIGAGVQVVRTGDAGARAVWSFAPIGSQ